MVPGPDAIEALASIHAPARWAWWGDETEDDDELNRGSFALLELYPKHEVDNQLYERWNDKGPIYGAPFDRDRFVPLLLWSFTPEEVESRRFVPVIRDWLTPMRKRMIDTAMERADNYEGRVASLSGEMGNHLHWLSQRNNSSPNTAARKFLTPAERAALAGDIEHDTWAEYNPFR